MFDEVEEGLLSPVHVVEADDQRRLQCRGLERLSHRPENIVHRRHLASASEEGGDPRASNRVDSELLQPRRRFLPEELDEYLDDRPERDAVAVGETLTPEDARAGERGEELVAETRLSDAGGPEHREEMGCPFGRHAFPGLCQQFSFAFLPMIGA